MSVLTRLALAVSLTLLLAASAASAATFTVGTTSDNTGTCANPATDACSLRQLIAYENIAGTNDTIVIPAGSYPLTNGQLNITQSVTIAGAGAQSTTVSQNTTSATSRVFAILANPKTAFTPTVAISGLRISYGKADSTSTPAYFGGNIINQGTLTLSEDMVEYGTTTSGSGAGISNDGGTLTVTHSLVAFNGSSQTNDSGGIQNFGPNPVTNAPGKLTVIDSTVAGNTSAQGGGIMSWSDSDNTATVINSTIAGNDGGGRQTVGGGLLAADGGAISVENSILAGNTVDNPSTGTASNCGAAGASPGTITSLGHNLESGTDCGFTSAGDLQNTDPRFTSTSPQDNGGNTDTLALQVTSPAVDAIPAGDPNCTGTDQHDVARPQGSGCDIGAFETLQPLEGSNFTTTLADSTCGALQPITIDWGDGTSPSSGTTNSNAALIGSHTYAEEGTYNGTVTWMTVECGTQTAPFTIKVPDAPLSATPTVVSATAGRPFTGEVAIFTDADPGGSASDYTATIDWGDGSSSPGTVSAVAGGFAVNGTHTYASTGSYPTTVSISDAGGASTVAHGTATVGAPVSVTGAPAVTPGAPSVAGAHGAAFGGSVNPEGLPTTARFEYGLDRRYSTPGASGPTYTQSTPSQNVGSDFSAHTVSATVTGLVPNAIYHVRLVATNSAGTTFGPDVTFTTKPAPPPGAPTIGKTFNASVVHGVVLIRVHGVFVPLTQLRQIPSGTLINALHGTLRLVTADGGGLTLAHDAAAATHGNHRTNRKKHSGKPKTQTGTFGGAVFKISQARGGPNRGLVTLSLVENAFKGAPTYASCKQPPARDATTARIHGRFRAHRGRISSRVLQLLHSSAHGRFRTRGRYSAATVRGTRWTIADRCDGTLTHDITDSVMVRDFLRHKTVILHAGQRYLAKARR